MTNLMNSVESTFRVLYDKLCDMYHNGTHFADSRIYPDIGIIKKYKSFFQNPTHIIDNIYIGSAFNAASYNTLKNNNIGLIINVTNAITNYYDQDFIYRKYNIYDDNNESILHHSEQAYLDIVTYQDKCDNNILIHCFMGASRSASVIIYYLMKKKMMSFEKSLEYMLAKRCCVNLTPTYAKELQKIKEDI